MAAAFDAGYYEEGADDEDELLRDDVAEKAALHVPDAPDSFANKHKELM